MVCYCIQMRIKASCIFSGNSFSHKTIEQKTGLQLSNKKEVEDIQTVGPHKGETNKYGSASLYSQKGLITGIDNSEYELEWLVNTLTPHINT
jgi:hypothetical protein